MIILGGLVLQACVLGALLKPEKSLVAKTKKFKYGFKKYDDTIATHTNTYFLILEKKT